MDNYDDFTIGPQSDEFIPEHYDADYADDIYAGTAASDDPDPYEYDYEVEDGDWGEGHWGNIYGDEPMDGADRSDLYGYDDRDGPEW